MSIRLLVKKNLITRIALKQFGVTGVLQDISNLIDSYEKKRDKTRVERSNLKDIVEQSGNLLNDLKKIKDRFFGYMDPVMQNNTKFIFDTSEENLGIGERLVNMIKEETEHDLIKEINKRFITGEKR